MVLVELYGKLNSSVATEGNRSSEKFYDLVAPREREREREREIAIGLTQMLARSLVRSFVLPLQSAYTLLLDRRNDDRLRLHDERQRLLRSA